MIDEEENNNSGTLENDTPMDMDDDEVPIPDRSMQQQSVIEQSLQNDDDEEEENQAQVRTICLIMTAHNVNRIELIYCLTFLPWLSIVSALGR